MLRFRPRPRPAPLPSVELRVSDVVDPLLQCQLAGKRRPSRLGVGWRFNQHSHRNEYRVWMGRAGGVQWWISYVSNLYLRFLS